MGEVPGIEEVEAVLFASGKAMEEDHIKELTRLKPQETKQALEALKESYAGKDSALFIWNEGTKWKINVKEKYVGLVKTLAAETELSMPVLETLAVIAYRTPILQSEVIKTRGEGAYEHVAELADKGFITKERFGRSYKLKIADKFYHYFDVTGDQDIRDAFSQAKQPDPEKHAQRLQKRLGRLRVVDAESDEDREKARKETQLEIYSIEQQREDDKKHYLNGFESRLQEVKGRVDEAEKDILEKKREAEARLAEEGQGTGGEAPTKEALKEQEKKDYEDEDPQDFVKDIESRIDELTKNE
ncbi:SMC-Scp complex subunit ScpB [Candidatus Woesearchaeota archaeon]|nr:SMC-Scp complex subunit ScpB [Candidatus Woesearchaeota archaeon]